MNGRCGKFDDVPVHVFPQTNVGSVLVHIFIIDRLGLKFSSLKSQPIIPVILESFLSALKLSCFEAHSVFLAQIASYDMAGWRGM